MMHWTWILARPARNGCVRYEDWLLWHYHLFSRPRGIA